MIPRNLTDFIVLLVQAGSAPAGVSIGCNEQIREPIGERKGVNECRG